MMPPEGPNKTEELLQRYAKERREQGGDFSLHPATRRLLQGEVARRFGGRAKEKSGWRAWFGDWRGWLTLGTATAVVVTSTWLVWNHSRPEPGFQLAKNDQLADLGRLAAEPALRPEPAVDLEARDKKLAANDSRFLKEQAADGEKQKASGIAAVTLSDNLTPAQSLSRDASRLELFGGTPATNAADYYAFIVPESPRVRNYSVPGLAASDTDLALGLDRRKARGLLPAGPLALSLSDEARDGAVRFGELNTNSLLANGGTVFYDVAGGKRPATLTYQTGDTQTLNEFSESAVRSEIAKAKTEGRTLTLLGADASGLTRERKLSEEQLVRAPTAAAPQNVPLDAPKLNEQLASATTAPRPLGAVAATAGALVRTDANGASEVFFRQSSLDDVKALAEVDRRVETLQKKAEKNDGAPEVLSRFVVEQTGQTIRLVDADGSLYEGAINTQAVAVASELESVGQRAKDNLVREQTVALKSEAPRSSGQEYSFRAAGSNVTLRQLVIVNGRLNAVPTLPSGVSSGVAGGAALAGTTPAPAPTAAPSLARRAQTPMAARSSGGYGFATNATVTIEGTVRVGGASEQPFKAVRAPR